MHVQCLSNTCWSITSGKIFVFYRKCQATVLLIQMHHKTKIYLWWWSIHKTCQRVLFLRSYRVAVCSFIKNKTPLEGFFQFCNKIGGSLWRNTLVIKLLFPFYWQTQSLLSLVSRKWIVFLAFTRERISYGPYCTRCYHFSHSFPNWLLIQLVCSL